MVAEKKLQVVLNRKNGAMTPKLKGPSPLFKKCALLDTITFHLNPFRATFLFKKAPTKTTPAVSADPPVAVPQSAGTVTPAPTPPLDMAPAAMPGSPDSRTPAPLLSGTRPLPPEVQSLAQTLEKQRDLALQRASQAAAA